MTRILIPGAYGPERKDCSAAHLQQSVANLVFELSVTPGLHVRKSLGIHCA
jgi:hypothetical protein